MTIVTIANMSKMYNASSVLKTGTIHELELHVDKVGVFLSS